MLTEIVQNTVSLHWHPIKGIVARWKSFLKSLTV
jgi:hypothetical protein